MATNQGGGLSQAQRQKTVTVDKVMLANALMKSDSDIREEIDKLVDENPVVETVAPDDNAPDTGGDNGRDNEAPDYDPEDDNTRDQQQLRTYSASGDKTDAAILVESETSLEDYLTEQIGELQLTEAQEVVAQNIIGNLDSNGWLIRTTQAIADDVTFNDGVEVENEDVEQVLGMIQHQLDPPGIACRTLVECVLLQLERFDRTENVALATTLVKDHIEELKLHHYDRLCTLLGIDKDRLEDVLKVIHKTNPRPGNGYSSGTSERKMNQVTPEFEVTVDDGVISCELVNKLDNLCISKSYTEGSSALKRDETLKKRYEEAKTFIAVLQMRQEKLFAVMEAIISLQRDYFLSGGDTSKLRPITYKVIEEQTGINQSTISRVCSSKYVMTPWGTNSLKDFFSTAVGDVSNKAIKSYVQAIVDGEDKTKPLTDDAIMHLLEEKYGQKISRRTVAKYRDALGIADRTRRKQL